MVFHITGLYSKGAWPFTRGCDECQGDLLHPLEGCGHHTHRGCGLINESVVLLQAVAHLRVAAEASEGAEERVDALHLLGGALKDLGDLDQAEKVRVQAGMGGADPSH